MYIFIDIYIYMYLYRVGRTSSLEGVSGVANTAVAFTWRLGSSIKDWESRVQGAGIRVLGVGFRCCEHCRRLHLAFSI